LFVGFKTSGSSREIGGEKRGGGRGGEDIEDAEKG